LPLAFLLYLAASTTASAQSSAFTYQGKLTDHGSPADGFYDFEFRLFDAVEGGTQKGTTLTRTGVEVTNGTFSVQLEFAGCLDCFDGGARFLEVSVRPAGGGSYPLLTPRQLLTSTPYAIKALDAAQLGGQTASGFIQNTTTQQGATNFNISGNGTIGGTLSGNVVNAATQYQIGGLRMLSASGRFFDGTRIYAASNTFAGESAGINTNPSVDTFSVNGKLNSFFGSNAGRANTTGGLNSFFGASAGDNNITGSNNTMIGRFADVGANNLINATAIGAFARVDQNHSLVLGSVSGVNDCTAINNCDSVNVGIGTTAPAARLHVSGAGITRARVNSNDNAGLALTLNDQPGWSVATVAGSHFQIFNDAIGQNAFWINSATNNVGIGTTAPAARLDVRTLSVNPGDNTAVFAAPNIGPNLSHLHFGTTGDWYIRSASSSGKVILQDSGGNVGIGTPIPADKLEVNGIIRVSRIGLAGITPLCLNHLNQISDCSSSLRYKNNIAALDSGFELINRLRPVTFDWKEGGERDLGLVAEEVAKVEPLLVTRNDKGEIVGVKYDRINVALINAIKELKAENDTLKQHLKQQEERLLRLEAAMGAMNEAKK
jgi:hypothetical protein